MKKIICILLSVLFAVSVFACAKQETQTAEQTAQPAATEEPVAKVDVSRRDIVIGSKGLYEYSDNNDGQIVVTYPILQAQDNVALQTSLIKLNEELRTDAEATMERLKEYQFVDDCYSKTEASIIRSDSLVTSILFTNDYYAGGTHPWRTYTAKTFDTETGTELAYSDVVTNLDALKQKMTEEVKAYAEKIGETLAEDAQINPAWVLGYDGLVLYINAGDVLSYAASDIVLSYAYNQQDSLVEKIYANVPENRSVNLVLETIYVLGNGTSPYLGVSGVESVDEDGNIINGVYEQIYVSYGEKNAVLEDVYCYAIKPYAVHTPDGDFLYINTMSDNDYETIYVYALKSTGPEYVGVLDGTGFMGGIQVAEDVWGQVENFDPQNFTLGTRMEALSTTTGTKTYYVGTNGMPETKDAQYSIEPFQLTLKRRMTFSVIDLDTGAEKETKEYEKKSIFSIFRTDNESYVDARDEEGNTVRIFADMNYPQKVDGKDVEDVFDGVLYAG